MNKIRILIVDDHPLMREAVQTALVGESDLEVIGEAAGGADGVRLFKESRPDVTIVDLLMPGVDGLEAISQIREVDPQARILAFTSMENEERVLAAIQGWCIGLLPQDCLTRLAIGGCSHGCGEQALSPVRNCAETL